MFTLLCRKLKEKNGTGNQTKFSQDKLIEVSVLPVISGALNFPKEHAWTPLDMLSAVRAQIELA